MIRPEGGDLRPTLTSDIRIGLEGPSARARTVLRQGDTRFCALSWGSRTPPEDYEEAYKRLTWTAHHWQHWLARGSFPDHRWRPHLTRSALTLKGLTFAPTGAIAAAATTSLPETPRGERNWDYRYSWIRDATFALWGLFTLGFEWEASDYFAFVTDLVERDRGNLQIVYGIDGRCDLDEQVLLMPLLRFLPPDDPRIRATVLAIADELTRDGLVLRYQVDQTDDGLAGEEGAFTICSFWLVSALSEIGEHRRARDLCEKVLSYASPLHLYAEEIDPRSGRHLGNFPQAFTHLALINAVMHVIGNDRMAERLAASGR